MKEEQIKKIIEEHDKKKENEEWDFFGDIWKIIVVIGLIKLVLIIFFGLSFFGWRGVINNGGSGGCVSNCFYN